MKKLLVFAFALVLSASFAACGKGGDSSAGKKESTKTESSSKSSGSSVTLESMMKAADKAGYWVGATNVTAQNSVGGFTVVYINDQIPVLEFKTAAAANEYVKLLKKLGQVPIVNGKFVTFTDASSPKVKAFLEDLLNGRKLNPAP